MRAHVCIWRQCNKDPSAALGMTVLGERIGSQGRRAVFLEEGILVSQPSPLGEGAPQGRIGYRRHERQMRKAEKRAAYVGERESLTANDYELISASSKIILAPSSGRGRRAKRGGVGFPECGSTVSRGQPPPLRGTSFQRKEGEKRCCVYRHRYIGGEVGAFSAVSAAPCTRPYHFFSKGRII